ncbi:acyl-CoA dehydrogenase family protein [Novosphingobium sp. ERN07]|nr:acyl-CoA dehydrogenase family protein [Novosphingobium sp. ERN07]
MRQLLTDLSSSDVLRQSIEKNQPLDHNVWRALSEFGVLGTAIAEEFGGVGLGALELGIVSQEIGRAVAPVPFFSSVCQAAQTLALAGAPDQKMRWLPLIATGKIHRHFCLGRRKRSP